MNDGSPEQNERHTTSAPPLAPTVAPLLLILDGATSAPAWLAAIRYASQRFAWSASPECRFLSHCVRPELWPDASVSAAFRHLAKQSADGRAPQNDPSMEARQHEDRAVDHAMRLLWGTSGGSVYRPASMDERRIAAIVVPGSSTLDLRLGAWALGQRQSCGFWAGDVRPDLRSGSTIRRPVWVPRLPVEESAIRIIDACHALSRTLSNLRHLGLAGIDGRYDFWS